MANTIQKKIKWSKGQIVPELVERTDLDMFDSSAQNMDNVVSTVFGGVRSRSGTQYIDVITGINEETPTSITSTVFSSTTHFTDNVYKTTNTIGTNRLIALIDYGQSEEGVSTLTVKNISVLPYGEEITSVGTTTRTVPAGLYEVIVVGAGGGCANFADQDKYAGRSGIATGGSGAYVRATVSLASNTSYQIVVGQGGTGAGSRAYNQEVRGTSGGASSFGTNKIVCNGGGGGYCVNWNGAGTATMTGGSGGTKSTSGVTVIESYNGNAGGTYSGYARQSGGASVYGGYGAGGGGYNSSFNPQPSNGGNGFVKYTLLDSTLNVKITGSTNGTNWVDISTEVISATKRDIEVLMQYKYRYIKLEIDTEEETLPQGLSFQYIREDISSIGDTTSAKIIPFVYNNVDKYLLCLTNEKIQVFKNDTLLTIVTAEGLNKDYFDVLKYTQKDDTVIFTHQDMPPKILKRTGQDSFTFADLDIKNIPYTVFGTETTTHKTVGITPSGLEGAIKITADSSTFSSSWVGQYIDGNGGRLKVTEYVSGTVVNGYTVIPFYTTDKITSWDYISGYEPVWSVGRGWPRTCLFAQQRLWFGGSKGKPSTVWASRLGDYFNFKNSGNYDNDSIDVDLLTNDVIVNMVDNRGLHIFTTGQEITAAEGSYTPDKISFTINTRNGSVAYVTPVVLSGNVCYIEKNGKSLLNYVYDDSQAAYISDNVSMLSNLVNSPVSMDAEINSSRDRGDFLYIVMADGTMVIGCLVLSQDIKSLCSFKTSGTIKDVCCLVDETYILVERNNRTCLEKIVSGNLCDSIEKRYITEDTINGLYRQKGEDVYVWSDNRVYGRFKVYNNSVFLNNIPYEYCYIGIPFKYDIEGNPIAINHKTTSIKKRITTAELVCENTPVITFCGQKKKGQKDYKFYSCTKYGNDVRYTISGEFYPLQILSLQLNINYEG